MMDSRIMCDVKVDAQNDNPTKNNPQLLRFIIPFSAYKIVVLVLWPVLVLADRQETVAAECCK